MVITEAELREMWRDGRGSIPPFPPGTRFSPSAQDFLKTHSIDIVFSTSPSPQSLISPARGDEGNLQLPPRLRARLHTLHATLLLAGAHARRFRLPELADRLASLAAACAEIGKPEREARQVAPGALRAALAPEAGGPLPSPGPDDHEMALWLNFVRAQAQEVELEAAAASASPDVPAALGRLRAALGDLDRQFRAGKLAWKLPG